jgi:hypothetical protein
MSTANDREFQKRYMVPVEVVLSKKKSILVEADEGITPCTAEGLAGLRTMGPDSIITVGAQTHAADGNAGMIVTTKDKAASLSTDKAVTIQILSYGSRAPKRRICLMHVPASNQALGKAGIKVSILRPSKPQSFRKQHHVRNR